MKERKARILVVDDSLFMRKLVTDLLNADPELEVVGTAKNGVEALRKAADLRPDCITLDLTMPGWDGLTTLGRIMRQCPAPVVMLSAHTTKDAHVTMRCLEAGAVSFVAKPSGELSLDVASVGHELLREVKAASTIDIVKIQSLVAGRPTMPAKRVAVTDRIIVVGASTGGPQTLEAILRLLPSNLGLPMIVAQHMPSTFFTGIFAEHLKKACRLDVLVAGAGEVLQDGRVYLAPAGYQTRIVAGKASTEMSLIEKKAETQTPCIDITMKSAAKVYGRNAIGIILSGMGHDGREGMRAIKQAGGNTIAQDASALIFGMPRAVIEAGFADQVLPADAMAGAIEGLAS